MAALRGFDPAPHNAMLLPHRHPGRWTAHHRVQGRATITWDLSGPPASPGEPTSRHQVTAQVTRRPGPIESPRPLPLPLPVHASLHLYSREKLPPTKIVILPIALNRPSLPPNRHPIDDHIHDHS
jgi:hypothetical protein